jgi:hypothetical protein
MTVKRINMNTTQLNTPAAVAHKLGLHYNTILAHIAKGNLQTSKVGCTNVVTDEEIERFQAWHQVHGGGWTK